MAADSTGIPTEVFERVLLEDSGRDGIRLILGARLTDAEAREYVDKIKGCSIRVASWRSGAVVTADDVAAVAAHSPDREFALIVAVDSLVDDRVRQTATDARVSIFEVSASDTRPQAAAKIRAALKKQKPKNLMPVWLRPNEAAAAMGLWHRPTVKQVQLLAADGCTHIVTLLAPRETPADIRDACEKAGIVWIHLPLDGAHVSRLAAAGKRLRRRIDGVVAAMRERGPDGRFMFHCAAGIHRTGVSGYLVARSLGMEPEAAFRLLFALRGHTGRGVGVDRLTLAEGILRTEPAASDDAADDEAGAAAEGAEADEAE